MRVFIAVIVLIFSLQSFTKADDIRDFEIEGMSIGDSLLDYYSEKEIKKIKIISPNKKIKIVRANIKNNLKIYDRVMIWWFNHDKDYKIIGLSGIIEFNKDLKSCKKKQKEIVESIKTILTDIGFMVFLLE